MKSKKLQQKMTGYSHRDNCEKITYDRYLEFEPCRKLIKFSWKKNQYFGVYAGIKTGNDTLLVNS